MNKNLLVCIIVAVVFFLLGAMAMLAYYYLRPVANPFGQPEGLNQAGETIKGLSSGVVVSTLADGQVQSIDGQNVTLTNNGESMVIPFVNSTEVNVDDTTSKVSGAQKQVNFNQIKVGDSLSVNLKVMSDGTMQAVSVFDSGAQ